MDYTAHGEHDRRYDRADEFMEVVMGHWDAWEDRAIVADRATGLFAHPEKVHRLDHKGEFSRAPVHSPEVQTRATRC
jgi:alkanesulfonate monooxygenase SsuD/methylene tetrahydromethanopterin reductase-like flavin-dependent oxidoreductase (luciferase family)